MVKADMRKGMLLKGKIGAEERIYRVLDLKEKVLVLDCVKTGYPPTGHPIPMLCGQSVKISPQSCSWELPS